MKKSALVFVAGAFFMAGVLLPDAAFCKKGGIGSGGGYSEDGTLYHSHSDRSYSGKGAAKGLGKGHFKEKKKEKINKGKGAGKNKWQ